MTDTPETVPDPDPAAPVLEAQRRAIARAVRTDCADDDCTENQPLPAALSQRPAEQKSPAEWAYQRLVLYIQNFEKQLDGAHEIGMGVAGSDAGPLHIRGMGYFAPDLVTFYGVDQTGMKTQLVQHVSQLNVMLRAVPKQTVEPTRIGFRLSRALAEDENAGAEQFEG